MTKSAKRDTPAQPAELAETESAATTDDDEATPAADAKLTDIAELAADATTGADAKPDLDDVKAKFRAALDRKSQSHSESQGKAGRDGGKVSGAHGPAASRRNFRRKSG